MKILAADIGGSHITTGVYDQPTQTVIPGTFIRSEVKSKGSLAEILHAWSSALCRSKAAAGVPITGVAIAMPGPFDYGNGISYIRGLNKYESLYEANVKEYLSQLMDLHPSLVRFRNDAEATIAGEVAAGAGKGCGNVLGITLGTGFGSAHCTGDRTIDLNLGGESFLSSIADDHLSTRWFVKRYYELTGISVEGVKELAALADQSYAVKKVFKEFAGNLSDFLSPALKSLNPEMLLICGNIAKSSRHFLPALRNNLGQLDIHLGQQGEGAALIGAATLFDKKEAVNVDKYA